MVLLTLWACSRQPGPGDCAPQTGAIVDRRFDAARSGKCLPFDAPGTPPVVEIFSGGGNAGGDHGGVALWAEGTVSFHSRGCSCGAHVERERVDTLLAALDRAGFARLPDEYPSQCCDMPTFGLSVRRSGVVKTSRYEGIRMPSELSSMINIVKSAMGPDPCARAAPCNCTPGDPLCSCL